MASSRSRQKNTVGTRLNGLEQQVGDLQKDASSPSGDTGLDPNSVGRDQIQPGAVGTNELGTVNVIKTDSWLALFGPNYPKPPAGTKVNLAMDENGRVIQTTSGGGGNVTTVSATAPVGASNGDGWLNTVDGSLYVWYYDGNSGQWIQPGANYTTPSAQATISAALNGNFRTNQRAYTSGTSIPISSFAFDRWRASGAVNMKTDPRSSNLANFTFVSTGTVSRVVGGGPTAGLPNFVRNTIGASGNTYGVQTGSDVSSSQILSGGKYVFSAWVRSSVAAPIYAQANGTNWDQQTIINIPANTWTRVVQVITAPAGLSGSYNMRVFRNTGSAAPAGATFDITGWSMVLGDVDRGYFDGSMTDCAWTGTVDASTSTNVPNVVPTLTFTSVLQGQPVTLSANGRICQTIERREMTPGIWTLAHDGTALMRAYNAGITPGSRPAFSSGPIQVTIDGTDDVVIEFGGVATTSIISKVRFIPGATDWGYVPTSAEQESRSCQRYYYRITSANGGSNFAVGQAVTGNIMYYKIYFPVPMRFEPRYFFSGTIQNYRPGLVAQETLGTLSTVVDGALYTDGTSISMMDVQGLTPTSSTVGAMAYLQAGSAGAYMEMDAELR